MLTWLACRRQPALPHPSGLPKTPEKPSIARVPLYEALHRGSHCSPFRTSPLLLPVDGSHGSRDFPRASHPTAQTLCDACRERGRALSTHPELTTSHTALHSVSSLETCDLVSQRQKRSSSSTPNSSPVRSSGLRPVPGNDILICRWSRGYSWAFHDAWARTAQALEGRAGLRTGAPNPRQRGKQTRGQCSGSYLNES